tara:strand:- start:266 stop:640 length:375 start_codon:yes stop_codon:yes gene_type:complete
MNLKIEIKRFIFIGLLSTFLNYIVYLILISLTSNIIFSSFFGYVSGLINSFIFGKTYVFRNFLEIKFFLLIKYLLIYAAGGLIMTLIIFLCSKIGFNYTSSWLLGVSVSVVNNFLGCKYYVFRK